MRFLIICLLLVSTQVHAQIPTERTTPIHQMEFGYGLSLRNIAIRGLLELKNDVQTNGTSVLVAGYEFRATNWLALGLGYTQQKLDGSYTYELEVDQLLLEDTLTFSYDRWAIVLEPKVYYPLGIDWLELYSSVRLGFKSSSLDANSTNNNIDELLKLSDLIIGNPLNASITPLGVNLLINPHIGISLAGNLGPTYFTRASLIVRF